MGMKNSYWCSAIDQIVMKQTQSFHQPSQEKGTSSWLKVFGSKKPESPSLTKSPSGLRNSIANIFSRLSRSSSTRRSGSDGTITPDSNHGKDEFSEERRDSESSFSIQGIENVDSDFSDDEGKSLERRESTPTPRSKKLLPGDIKDTVTTRKSPEMDARRARTMSERKMERPSIVPLWKSPIMAPRINTPIGTPKTGSRSGTPVGPSPRLTPETTPITTPRTSDPEGGPKDRTSDPGETPDQLKSSCILGGQPKTPLVSRRKSKKEDQKEPQKELPKLRDHSKKKNTESPTTPPTKPEFGGFSLGETVQKREKEKFFEKKRDDVIFDLDLDDIVNTETHGDRKESMIELSDEKGFSDEDEDKDHPIIKKVMGKK